MFKQPLSLIYIILAHIYLTMWWDLNPQSKQPYILPCQTYMAECAVLGVGFRSQLFHYCFWVQEEPGIMIFGFPCTSKLKAGAHSLLWSGAIPGMVLTVTWISGLRPWCSLKAKTDNQLIISPSPCITLWPFQSLMPRDIREHCVHLHVWFCKVPVYQDSGVKERFPDPRIPENLECQKPARVMC